MVERQRERARSALGSRVVWNFMQTELIPDDRLVRPMIGPGGLTREAAHAEVQALLDRVGPVLAPVAAAWRRGAKDDVVFAGPFAWTIYEHPEEEDPRAAALVWLEDYAATMRRAGLDVQVAQLP
jgi:hypothetical protein